jgi:cytochrome c oxidase subunit II
MQVFSLFPPQGSAAAPQVDHLLYYLLGVSAFFSVLIFVLIFYFAVKYRRTRSNRVAQEVPQPIVLEIAWILIPLVLVVIMFVWGAKLFVDYGRPPANAQEIFVVAKQWMWKVQHPEGNSEIDELHVPLGRPIKLIMTSQDVIHDFFVPAFRIKKDVVPGRYTELWFQPTQTGQYHFFCSQYCGTNHSLMRGFVYVMEPADYERWIKQNGPAESLAQSGEKLFQSLACINCHQERNTGRGPSLVGVFGKPQRLESGDTVIADAAYLRDSIINPRADIVAGYPPIMPTYKGQINEEQLLQLISYIQYLGQAERK